MSKMGTCWKTMHLVKKLPIKKRAKKKGNNIKIKAYRYWKQCYSCIQYFLTLVSIEIALILYNITYGFIFYLKKFDCFTFKFLKSAK